MKLTDKSALLYRYASFLQAADRLGHNQVGVNVALQKATEEGESVLVAAAGDEVYLSLLEVDVGKLPFMSDLEDLLDLVLVHQSRTINCQELILEHVLDKLCCLHHL